MITARRALPWALSVTAHALFLLIPVRLALQPIVERRVEIDLALESVVGPSQPGRAAGASVVAAGQQQRVPASAPQQRAPAVTPVAPRPVSPQAATAAARAPAAPAIQSPTAVPNASAAGPTSAGSQGAAAVPLPRAAANPSGAAVPPPPSPESLPLGGRASSPSAVVAPVAQTPAQARPPVATPNAADVLADLAADVGSPAAGGRASGAPSSQLAASSPSGSSASDRVLGSSGSPQSQIGWETDARRLIRKRDPQFPLILSAEGQEVECDARITVSPAGAVTRVEIIRSSGYTEIDASVEAALRGYLFSRVDGRKDAVGTVRFRFRLEKRD